MKEALSSAVPDVLVGVNTMQYDMKENLNFKVIYQPTPRFGTLSFKVTLTDENNGWRKLQFNFIATSHKHLLAGTLEFN